jgi:hypothetical protein
MQDRIEHDCAMLGMHLVDIDRLLDIKEWRKEYDGMLEHLDLEPNYDQVEQFAKAGCKHFDLFIFSALM